MGYSISDGPDKLGESSTEAGTTLEGGGAEGALAPRNWGVQKGEQKEKQTIYYY